MTKTHWKKAFKSDYLASSDIDSGDLKLTIKNVRLQECITASGKKMCNVAHFKESGIKPMILNVTNSKMVKKFSGNKPHLEDWIDIPVSVYVDPKVKFGSELTEGLRIRPVQPKKKTELVPNTETWNNAVKYLKGNGTIDKIKENYTISSINESKLKSEVI